MMNRRDTRILCLLIFCCLGSLATALPSGATQPGASGPPVYDVTGCVRGSALLLAMPQAGSGAGAVQEFRIVPCGPFPIDLANYQSKLIRAQGDLNRRDNTFVCPRNVLVLGDCPKGFGAPPPASDSSPCETIDMRAVNTPADFEITYAAGPAHADRGGRTTLSVTAKGDVTEKESAPSRNAPGGTPAEGVKTYRIAPERVKLVYAAVLACRFFDLERVYAAQGVVDGGSQFLRVRAGDREHTVSVRNSRVERFNRIVSTLMGATAPAADSPGGAR